MASKPSMALNSTISLSTTSSTFFDGLALFSTFFAVLACILAFTDGWFQIAVASEELMIVVVLLLLPLAFNIHFRRPAPSKACQKKIAEENSDSEEEADRSLQEDQNCGDFHTDQTKPSSTTALEPKTPVLVTAPECIATASADGSVMLWGASGQCDQKLEGHTGALSAVAFSTDGTVLVTGAFDGTARIWDVKTGACEHILDDGGGVVYSVALSPCRSLLLTGLDDHCAQLWRITGKDTTPSSPELILEGHTSTVASVAFSPCGTFAATGSYDGTVRIWNVASGSCEHVLQGHDAEVFSVTFSPCGEMLATTSQDGTARLWSVGAGWCIMTLDGHDTAVRSSAFSPCGQLLATGCWDGTVKLWDIDAGVCQLALQTSSPCGPIHSMDFSKDGSIIAIVDGSTVRLYNTNDGTCFKVLEGHTDSVQSVAISP